jgi:hypothetical protein
MSLTARKILIPLLLVGGVQLWLLWDATLRRDHMVLLAAAVLLAAIPPVHRVAFRLIQKVRHVTARTRAITTLCIFAISVAYLVFTAIHQGRPLYPKYHDNQSYAVQARIIASGHLWLPAHAHPEFFDTFHVLVEPVYASMYFPGAAMVFAGGLLVGLKFWVTAVLIAAGCLALTYRVTAQIVDNFAGLLAPLWLVSLGWFRHLSAMLMSHTVLLLLGLTMLWAFLRWREHRRLGWCLVIGLTAGFAAITRPADALCYAIPIGIAMLLDLRDRRYRGLFPVGATIVAGAVPFLALQVVFNLGVSGKPFESPYRTYLDRDAPQLSFGFHKFDKTQVPKSSLRQKHLYHESFNGPLIQNHRPDKLLYTWFDPSTGRLRTVIEATTPTLILTPLLLIGILGLTTRARWAFFLVLPLYFLLYLFYAALLQHYTPVIAPSVILLGVLGMRELESTWPRLRAGAATLAATLVVGTCVLILPEVNPRMEDDPFPYPEIIDSRVNIPKNVEKPALVFITFREGVNIHAEPVYNHDAAAIDDNPVIYAHDLGAHNVELLRYYLERQPQRHVYRYDRLTRRLAPRGTIVDELKRLTSQPATTQTTQPAKASSTQTAPAAP